MSLLLDDVADYLVDRGVATSRNGSGAWPVWVNSLPDDTDQAMCLYETGGYPADEISRSNERVTFQFRVRGSKLDYLTVRAKWQSAFDALQDAQEVSGSPVLLPDVVFIQALHYGPLPFNDDKGRTNMTVNFQVKRRLV